MNLKTKPANPENCGGKRDTKDIRYIVIHYTGNDGDTDENNGIYFGREAVSASAHYFVDSDSVTQSVPDDMIAYHCGARTYQHPDCRNANSLGVELCDDKKDGTIYPSARTIANALELTEFLMQKYGVPKSNVIRHYDVSGKYCPAYWCGDESRDHLWKTAFWNRLPSGIVLKKTISLSLPTLREGDTGASVRAMQQLLIASGYDCGGFGADGDFGRGTYDSVWAYQRKQALGPDGICGRRTWGRLLGVD